MPLLSFKPRFVFLLFLASTILLSAARLSTASSANGSNSHWIEDDEDSEHPTMESSLWEDHRRALAQNQKYISYSALKKNSVPCNKKGNSYYNCNSRQKANPYNRGCSKVTNCYRYTDL
uniref:Uncharacterized protein n=1 Tax=Kalanchoe fedtschenkoi TaxID=63787 RepID=A0A7N0V1X3_KALFE